MRSASLSAGSFARGLAGGRPSDWRRTKRHLSERWTDRHLQRIASVTCAAAAANTDRYVIHYIVKLKSL